ncbi:MAG TPA: penicillin-binding transpeptidase domain-containing protein [Bacilli bacterium]
MQRAERSWKTSEVLQPKRGTIVDRNGKILSEDVPAYTVALNPKIIHEGNVVNEVVNGLAPILGMDTAEGREKLLSLATKKREDGSFQPQVEVRIEGWKIDADVADQIKELIAKQDLPGIYLLPQQKRYYPGGSLAAHVIGYTNKEGDAVMGAEFMFDDLLQGTPGSISYEKDLHGNALPNSKVSYKPPKDGKTVMLTIDRNIQHFVDDALRQTFAKYKPKSAMAIVADPNTMDILAMDSLPDFNPNKYWLTPDQSYFINHAITSQYEPGSTFKIVTLSGAVQEGLFHPNDTYESGTITVGGATIHDHNWVGWGRITYLEGLKRSSNVAFVKLGYEGLGEKKLRDYIQNFGFGVKTGIDLPGESAGIIDFRWPSEVATATFGQGKVTVTALQQVAAVAAVANGGVLLKPHILKEVIDPASNKPIKKVEPEEVRRVISADTAHKVAGYLEQVVSDQQIGTGRRAYLKEYSIAGKTGTAQKVINGEYAEDRYVVSFVGFAPVEDPKIAVIVIVDDPALGGDYRAGGEVAAPVFKSIVLNTLRYLGVPSRDQSQDAVQVQSGEMMKEVPDLTGLPLAEATAMLQKKQIAYGVLGAGQKVIKQFPGKGAQIGAGQQVLLLTDDPAKTRMPDLTGKSLRDALEVCGLLQAECTFSGEGFVSGQKETDAADGKRSVTIILTPPAKPPANAEETEAE